MSDLQTATSPPRHILSWMAALNGWWISWKLYYGIPFSINLLLLIDASSSPKFPEAGEASGQRCLDNRQGMSAAPLPLPWTYQVWFCSSCHGYSGTIQNSIGLCPEEKSLYMMLWSSSSSATSTTSYLAPELKHTSWNLSLVGCQSDYVTGVLKDYLCHPG